VRGPIGSSWRRAGEELELTVGIPPNVTATVVLPDGRTSEVGSGTHAFTASMAV
jgi:alpha-L-rhamnosidase